MDNKLLKTVAIGGFDKKEVLKYICLLENENKMKIKKEESKLNELTLKFEEVKNKNKLLEEEIVRLKTNNEKIENKKNKLRKKKKL
ncbi:hypothetical protein [Clostridium tertium]|uniref:hypothetical protein n=1 Tax=Clostridium tertium TaxID=1559 RepID=UPI00374FA330